MSYESNKKYLLIFSALIIGINIFKIPIPDKIPFSDMTLPSDYSIPILSIITLYFYFYTVYSWIRLNKEEKSYLDLLLTITIGTIALSFYSIEYLSSIGVNWKNAIAFLLILLLGLVPSFLFTFIITVLFSIRSKERSLEYGLSRIPTASKALIAVSCYIFLPIIFFTLILFYYYHTSLPYPINIYYLYIYFTPIIIINIGTIINLILCFIPGNIRKKAIEKLRITQTAMDIHEMHYQYIGIEDKKPYKQGELFKLAYDNEYDMLKLKLKNGANPNEQDSRGWTPLMIASAERNKEIVELLLEYGADPNIKNYLNRTALNYSSRYGFIEIVKLLLKNGANPNIDNIINENSPLMAASEFGHLGVVKLLIEYGADVSSKCFNNRTALDLAEENKHGDIAKVLRNELKNIKNENIDNIVSYKKWL
ncbi:ankyrin repeat domain-containing protein [Aliarcobacter butzleri]|uniref:ankyrin repeat domain-containing protein n=1 Tax=Aliarcobacter butzleri TaxID=28197 RepID=UPI0012FCAD92|nr:ankyrin repeat domain-containing protein [Aliarcobacter butzleri]